MDNVERFLGKMRTQFEQDVQEEQRLREEFILDMKFVAGDQWNEQLARDREAAGRPVLTFNRCHTFVQQVANEARQMRGEIKFVGAEDSDKDLADVFEGLARHIQYNSKARVAYETAVDYSAGGSFGYYRFVPEYCDDSWNQEIKVVPVTDPLSVYGVLIPACYGIDPDHCFHLGDPMSKEEFAAKYPKSDAVTLSWAPFEQAPGWLEGDKVRVVEYWWVEHKTETVKHPTDEKRTRTVVKNVIKSCKTNGVEILPGDDGDSSETAWPGKRIPTFAVLGKCLFIKGEPRLLSVVRFQRAPQQLINLYKSRIAETIGIAPISPFFVPKGAIPEDGYNKWARMNKEVSPFLEYNTIDAAGNPVQMPTRNTFEPPIAALSEASAQEIDDMKAAAGIFDASLGAKSNTVSGKAKLMDQQQSNVTNMHYIDNLERSFNESGTELALVMPVYYDMPRTVRILGPDEAPKVVKINQDFTVPRVGRTGELGPDGRPLQRKRFDITEISKFDVLVTMGRAFSSKRMESYSMMSEVLQGNPELMNIIGDIFFKNSDMAGADQLAERFKKMLPPALQDAQDGQPEIPPQVQAQMAQVGQQVQQMQLAMQQLTEERDDLKARELAKVVESQSREKIADSEQRTRILIAEIGAKSQDKQLRMKMEQEQWKILHGSAHTVAMDEVSREHDAQMADAAHQRTLEQGAINQQYAQQQAEAQPEPVTE